MLLPEAPQREGEPDRDRWLGSRDHPVKDDPEVVVRELEAVAPLPLVVTGELGGRSLGKTKEPVAMAIDDGVLLAAGREALPCVLPDRLQQSETRLTPRRLIDAHEALVCERREAVDDVDAEFGGRAEHGFGRLDVSRPREHRQAVEQTTGSLVEDVVAPGDRAAKRLVPRRPVEGRARGT